MTPLKANEDEVKEEKRFKNLKTKQSINQISNIVSTNKSWNQFIQIKKRN